jgi:hypothetical protein
MNGPSQQSDISEHLWERGWDEHERQQLQRLAKLPLSERIAWLEEAQRLVQHLAVSKNQNQKPKP